MTNYVRIALVLCGCVALSVAQYDFGIADFSGAYLATSFGAPQYNGLSAAAARDPRANTGPVVFPPSPPGDPSQTSGVVVGASGYGFQPPGAQGRQSPPNKSSGQGPAVPRYFYRGFFLR